MADELDIASAPQLERMLRRAELSARLVVLDLRELTFMDSFGLRLIADSSHRARRTGRRLLVLRGPAQVQRLFALSRAAQDLEIVEPGELEPAVHVLLQLARAGDVTSVS